MRTGPNSGSANENATHEASKSAEREAAEDSGQVHHGRHGTNEDPTHEGWYDDSFGEIGDMCAWKFRPLGGYTVQLPWSNAAGACV